MKPVAVVASGMVTGVGLNAASSCAAIRCGIDNFSETRFVDKGGETINGSHVVLEQPYRRLQKLRHMAAYAVKECLAHTGTVKPDQIPLLLCVAEKERPGRLEGLNEQLLPDLQMELGVRFHRHTGVIAKGRVGGAMALGQAHKLIYEEGIPLCIIAGVDSLLLSETLAAYEEKDRLLTSENSNGFIPGEAGAAVLVAPPSTMSSPPSTQLLCLGIGTGQEKATIDSETPLRADGLVEAIKAAIADAGCSINDLDYRITDSNGEQYWFKEATLALDRVLRNRKELFDIWNPADCLGEVGAAIGPCAMGVALQAAHKNYAFGRGPLCHFSGENSERVAVVFKSAA